MIMELNVPTLGLKDSFVKSGHIIICMDFPLLLVGMTYVIIMQDTHISCNFWSAKISVCGFEFINYSQLYAVW